MKDIFPRKLFIPPKTGFKFENDALKEYITKLDAQNSDALRRALGTNLTKQFIQTLYRKATSTPPENINIEIKGETRSGKSTLGIFLGKLISYYYGVEFTEDNILPNQGELLYRLKDAKWGETFLVDEQTPESYGEGILRETSQLGMNLNICAKKCNNLIFVYPPHFTMRNAPFGLETVAKDTKNKYVKAYYHDLRTKSFGFGGIWPRGYIVLPKYQDEDYQNKPQSKWNKERLKHLKETGYDFDSLLEQNYETKKDAWIEDVRGLDASVRDRKKQEFAEKLAEDGRFLAQKSKGRKEAYIQLLMNQGEIMELSKTEIGTLADMAMVIASDEE